jgi:hypothetical protein
MRLLVANEKLSLEIVQRKRAEEELKKAFDEIAILKDQLGYEKRYLEEEIRQERGFEEILGESPALQNNVKQVAIVAPTLGTAATCGRPCDRRWHTTPSWCPWCPTGPARSIPYPSARPGCARAPSPAPSRAVSSSPRLRSRPGARAAPW